MKLLILAIVCGLTLPSFGDGSGVEPFVFIGVTAASAGPSAATDRFFYVSGTGYAQSGSIRDDAIVGIEETQVAAESLMHRVEISFPEWPRAFTIRGDGLPSADAPIPTYVRIAVRLASGRTYDWAGYETGLSPAQKDLAHRVEEFVPQGRALTNEKPPAYIAAFWLDDATAARFKREGHLQMIAAEGAPATSPLRRSLQQPFRLFAVSRGTNPFEAFHRSFSPGRDVVDGIYSGTALQIRSYKGLGSN